MHFSISLRKGIVYAPTMGEMDKGFYRGVEPVAVIPASNADALRQALRATIARGNPHVPMLPRREWPSPVVLKYAGVKNWSIFERGMRLWSITERDEEFQIAEQKKQSDRMWRDDPEQIVSFPPGTPADEVIDRMVAILQDAAARKAS
jgi:hypothetical protein